MTTSISRRDLLLLLVGLRPQKSSEEGLGGITRIQKLLFLLEKEHSLTPTTEGFSFTAYKAGPYSPKVYDDLEFLENLGFLRREPVAEATDEETAEMEFTFEDLMGPNEVMEGGAEELGFTRDSFEENKYYITDKGRKKVEEMLKRAEYTPFVEGIRKTKSKYANYSLNDLLYHVYTRFPDMTTESEIKEKVLRRRPS